MQSQNNQMINVISRISGMMQGKDPRMIYNMMMQKNPQFANFVNQNMGKSAEQIAQENGIDFSLIKQFMR